MDVTEGQVLPDPPLSQETADTPLPSATSDTPPVMESAHPPLPPPQEQECSATSSMADQEAKASADGETIPPEMDTEISGDDFGDVIDKLWDARTKWYYIGVRFGITAPELDVIEMESKSDVSEMFRKMIRAWLKKGENCTWRAVYDALKHRTVEQQRIAEELKSWLVARPVKGKKQKSEISGSPEGVCSKKVKVFNPQSIKIRRGPRAPSEISKGSVVVSNDNAYFASGSSIQVFNVSQKEWRGEIECDRYHFGLAAIDNELVAVGGLIRSESSEKYVATNTVVCLTLSDPMAHNTWKEKYPAMNTARISPEVVVTDKYLIALAGWTEIEAENKVAKPTRSVELLDKSTKCWHTNQGIHLPNELNELYLMSACVCDDTLYIATQHEDPNFSNTMQSFIDEGSDDDSEYPEYRDEDHLNPESGYECFSLHRCSINSLVRIAQTDVVSKKVAHCWQHLNRPHPSVYENENEGNIPYQHPGEEEDYYAGSETIEISHLRYHQCKVVLSCINSYLLAVGCEHVKGVTPEDNDVKLRYAYESYREKNRELYQPYTSDSTRDRCDIEEYGREESKTKSKCYIHIYNPEEDSWKNIGCTPDVNGTHADAPLVATVTDDKLVVVRGSTTVHICTFE